VIKVYVFYKARKRKIKERGKRGWNEERRERGNNRHSNKITPTLHILGGAVMKKKRKEKTVTKGRETSQKEGCETKHPRRILPFL
jgi:hypothetical protein